jgi:hypothetical protein
MQCIKNENKQNTAAATGYINIVTVLNMEEPFLRQYSVLILIISIC